MCIGLPGEVVEIIDPATQQIRVAVGGAQREVSAALLGVRDGAGTVRGGDGDPGESVGVGDWVAVHMGFAMERLDEAEAREILRTIDELQGEYERLLDARGEPNEHGAA